MNSEAQGRSGARFHTSYDKRYVIKTISSEDVAEMHNILKKYHQVCRRRRRRRCSFERTGFLPRRGAGLASPILKVIVGETLLLCQFIVECHGNTLLPQFLGMYRLTVDGDETYMIVTRNVFSHRLSVYKKYDLKVGGAQN